MTLAVDGDEIGWVVGPALRLGHYMVDFMSRPKPVEPDALLAAADATIAA
jgi:hypothetical protein